MSEDPRVVAVAKALLEDAQARGYPYAVQVVKDKASEFIAMYDALRAFKQQGEEVMQHQSGNRPTLEPGDNATAPAAPVTAGTDPQPGWYVVLHDTRVGDLLRDAARYRSREQEVVAARENLRDCGTALRMIRDAVEELGPVGAVPSRDIGPPNPVQDATDIITGIQALIDAKIAREEK